MEKTLKRLLLMSIYGTFFVPLVVLPSSFIFPFIVPKIVVFRSLVVVMASMYLILLFSGMKQYRLRWTPITITVLLFFTSFAISTFTGVDWYKSLWDGHERMLGLFTIAHYVVFFIVLTSVLKEWKDWKWPLRIFLFAGSLVMIIGFIQTYINHDLLLNNGGTSRVSASLGNAIYFSGYGLFLLFVGILLAIKEQNKKYNFWFWFAVVGATLGFWGIFGGGTRGALLGLLCGGGFALLLYIIFLKHHPKAKKLLVGVLALCIIGMGGLFAYRHTPFVQSIPAVGRLLNTNLSGGTANTRFMAWDIAFKAWQEMPVFGWGPNNYYYAFNALYNPAFLEHGFGETWFDNAHNVFMNTLATQGAVGILTYLALFIVTIVTLLRLYRSEKINIHISILCSSYLVAHFVSLLTVFENPTSYLSFFFSLAFINSMVIRAKGAEETEVQKGIKIGTGTVVSVGLLGFLLLLTTDVNPARANMRVLSSIRLLSSNPALAVEQYPEAIAVHTPHIDDVRNDFGRIAGGILRDPKYMSQPWFTPLLTLATEEVEKNQLLHPLDVRVHILLNDLYTAKAQSTGDMQYVEKMEELMRDALIISPKRQQLEYTLASILQAKGDMDGAIEVLKQSVGNNETLGHGWWRLVALYAQKGDWDSAVRVANEVLARDDVILDDQARSVFASAIAQGSTITSTEE